MNIRISINYGDILILKKKLSFWFYFQDILCFITIYYIIMKINILYKKVITLLFNR